MNPISCLIVVGFAAGGLMTLTLPASASEPQGPPMSESVLLEGSGEKGLAMPLGRTQTSWLVMGAEFDGRTSGFVPQRSGSAAELACAIGSTDSHARARLALPDGAVMSGIDIWRYDASVTERLEVSLWRQCLPSASAQSSFGTRLVSVIPVPVAPGYAAGSSVLSIPVDGLQCSYYAEVDFGAGCAAGQDLRLLGVRIRWGQP